MKNLTVLCLLSGLAMGADHPIDPAQIRALQVEAVLPFNPPARHVLFQEIAPCRLVATTSGSDPLKFPGDYGTGLSLNTTRTVSLVALKKEQPCFKAIPTGVVAVAVNVVLPAAAHAPGALSFLQEASPINPVVTFDVDGGADVSATTVVIGDALSITASGAVAPFTLDVLGYFLPYVETAGPAGEVGPKGDPGKDGTSCEVREAIADPSATHYFSMVCNGVTVSTWHDGAKGLTGPTGPKGEQGNVGNAGPSGVAGPSGPAGNSGPTGPQGVPGNPGAVGPAGAKGATGEKGATGAGGPQGPGGAPGAGGPAGPAGPRGLTGPSNCSAISAILHCLETCNSNFETFKRCAACITCQ